MSELGQQRDPPGGLAGFDRLCRLEDFLRGGEPLTPADRAVIADGIMEFRAGKSLEQALGMGGTWRHAEMLRRRDHLIRDLARDFGKSFPDGMAKGLAKEFSHYEEKCWPRERSDKAAPAIYRGQLRERIFKIFQIAGGNVPTSEKQISRILKPRSGHSLPLSLSADL